MMLTTAPADATAREIAQEIDELRAQMAGMTERLADATEPFERDVLTGGLKVLARRIGTLEALQVTAPERR